MHFGLLGNTSHSRELLIEAECLLVTFSFSFCRSLWSVNKLLSFDWIWHTTFSQQRDLFLVFNAFQCYQQYLAWGPLIKSELFFLTYPKFALSHMTASFPAGILVNDVSNDAAETKWFALPTNFYNKNSSQCLFNFFCCRTCYEFANGEIYQ